MENQKIVLTIMLNSIKGQARLIKDSTYIADEDKLEQVSTLLDIMKYIQNYNEYSQVIAEHDKQKARLSGKVFKEVTE